MSTSPTKQSVGVLTKNLLNITQGDSPDTIKDKVQGIRVFLSSCYTQGQVIEVLSEVIINLLTSKAHPEFDEDRYLQTITKLIADKIRGVSNAEGIGELLMAFINTSQTDPPIDNCQIKILKKVGSRFAPGSPQGLAVLHLMKEYNGER